MKNIAIFDLDHTLIDVDSVDCWVQFLIAHESFEVTQDFLDKMQDAKIKYQNGTLNFPKYLNDFIVPILNIKIDKIDKLVSEFFENKIAKHIYPKGIEAILKHKKQNDIILLISASPTFLIKETGMHLGFSIENIIGTKFIIKNDCYTNDIDGIITAQKGKITAYNNWCKVHNMKFKQMFFYSDSSNDIPLLEISDKAITINPDANLEKIAKINKWEILNWKLQND